VVARPKKETCVWTKTTNRTTASWLDKGAAATPEKDQVETGGKRKNDRGSKRELRNEKRRYCPGPKNFKMGSEKGGVEESCNW